LKKIKGILDNQNNKVLEVRVFGLFKDADIQDNFGKYVTEVLNKSLAK